MCARCCVDVVDAFPYIPLRQVFKNGAFRKDHAEHGMHLLYAAFLSAAHGIAVVYAAALNPVDAFFQAFGFCKLAAPVSETYLKYPEEIVCPEGVFQLVESSVYGAFCTAGKQACEEQLRFGIIEGKDAFQGSLC